MVNLALLSGMLASLELSLNIAKFIKHGVQFSLSVNSDEIQTGKLIPTKQEQVFHPGLGHSYQESEFNKNANTSKLSYDNISVAEVFQQQDSFNSEFNILVLGGSTTDPLGTQSSLLMTTNGRITLPYSEGLNTFLRTSSADDLINDESDPVVVKMNFLSFSRIIIQSS